LSNYYQISSLTDWSRGMQMKETIYVEIRAAEGGNDSKLLVHDMTSIYAKYSARFGLNVEIVDQRPGQTILEIIGENAAYLFRYEYGGQRFQRCPPTERKGRIHTSTITVATLKLPKDIPQFREEDLEETLYRKAAGNGGQNNNKTSTAVRLLHKPSGIRVECCTERSQKQNRETARRLLSAKVLGNAKSAQDSEIAADRRNQVGRGERSDKVRTFREQDDQVKDHRTGKKTTLTKIRQGFLELLF
jgi:peptide chain release factor 1